MVMKNNKISVNDETIIKAEEILDNMNIPTDEDKIKRIKRYDRGIIERTESSKVILVEDNRQLLND